MQFAPPPVAAVPSPPSEPWTLPAFVLAAPLGTGTVGSQLDRAVRIRFEGDGAPSGRRLVPTTKAAADLLGSPAGSTFERALRSALATIDGRSGPTELRSIAFVPDQFAAAAVSLHDGEMFVRSTGRAGIGDDLEPDEARLGLELTREPALRDRPRSELVDRARARAARVVADLFLSEQGRDLRSVGGTNVHGAIMVAPNESRALLASLGLYRLRPADELGRLQDASRRDRALAAWRVVTHELEHSVTPQSTWTASQATRFFEEASAELLGRGAAARAMREAGGDARRLDHGARSTVDATGWGPWSRAGLPAQTLGVAASARRPYVDGPALLEQLLHMAGIDQRRAPDRARAVELLQGERSARIPRRVAEAIVAHRGIDPGNTDRLTEAIRRLAADGRDAREVRELVAAATPR